MEQLMSRYRSFSPMLARETRRRRRTAHHCAIPSNMVLVGRRPSPEDRRVLDEARRQSEWSDVEIVHYDDLVDFARQRVDLTSRLAAEVQSVLE